MQNLESLCEKLEQAHAKVMTEENQRREIKLSPEYKEIVEQMNELQEKKDALNDKLYEMIAAVPESGSEYAAIKMEVMELLKVEQREGFGNVKAKFSTKKQVNSTTLINALQGDLTQFMNLAKPTQKAVTEFAKELDPEQKKAVLNSIEVVSREMTDISITPSKNV